MGNLKRWLIRIGIVLFVVIAIGLAVFWQDIQEIRGALEYAATFEADKIDENFRSLYLKYPSKTVRRGNQVYELPESPRKLTQEYVYKGQTKRIDEWIEKTDTTGLIVVKDGAVAFEKYFRGNSSSTRSIAMTVSKSIGNVQKLWHRPESGPDRAFS